MAISFECPVCEFQGKVADDQQGKEIACKGCGHTFVVAGTRATAGSHSGETVAAASGGTAVKQAPPKTAGSASGEMVVAQCPACSTKGRVPASARGKKVKCPKCSEGFVVPSPAAASAPPPAAAPAGPAAKMQDADAPIGSAGDEPEPAETKALADVPASDDIGLAPIDGKDAKAEEPAGADYEVVEDVAIYIDATCPGCKHKGNVPEKFRGKKVKCPRCSALFIVGGSGAAAARKTADTHVGNAPPPGEPNPFAGLDAAPPTRSGPVPTVKPQPGAAAPASGPAPANDNPFAFDDAPATPPAPTPAPAAVASTRPTPAAAPRAEKPAPKLTAKDFDEPSANTNNEKLILIAGGVLALAVLVAGGLIFMRLINSGSKETAPGPVAVAPVETKPEPREDPKPEVPKTELPPAKVDPPVVPPEPKPEPKVDIKPEPKPETKPDPKPEVKPDPLPPQEAKWVDATNGSVAVGDVRVRVVAAWVDNIKSKQGISPRKFLLVQLQLENRSLDKQANYHGWNTSPGIPNKAEPAVITDNTGKTFKIATVKETIVKPSGQLDREFIMPNTTADDLLVFEVPTAPVEFLRLELPALNLGGTGKLGLELPAQYVKGIPGGKPVAPEPGANPPPAGDRLAKLRGDTKNKLPAVRERAVRDLGELGAAAAPAGPDLCMVLKDDKNEQIRAAAAEALGKIGPAYKGSINPLIAALRDEFFKVKANACEALAIFGPDAKDAIPKLTELQKSKEEDVPLKASLALSKIDIRGRPKAPAPPPKAPLPKDAAKK